MDRYAEVHRDPKGPGDARPTAEQVLKDQDLEGNLEGKTILITGGTAGLGRESARVLQKSGAKVFITTRTQSKGDEIAKEISAGNPGMPPIEAIEMGLDSLESVRKGAEAFLRKSPRLNILLENAGVMAVPEGRTVDGFEVHFGVNHLAHFLLFTLLLPALKAGATADFHSRVVVVSSSGHRMNTIHPEDYALSKDYTPFLAYGQSKLCNVYLANEIERRYGAEMVHGWSLHPGVIFETELSRYAGGASAVEKIMPMDDPKFLEVLRNLGQGAATQVWACVARELEAQGGKYLDDVTVAKETDDPSPVAYLPGYKAYAYDEDMAKKLWEDSVKMIGSQGALSGSN